MSAAAVSYAAVFPLVRTRAFSEAFDYEVPARAHRSRAAGRSGRRAAGRPDRDRRRPRASATQTAHEGRVLPLRDVLRVPPIPADLLDVARRVARALPHLVLRAALTLVCPPTGALKIVRQYELTDAGRAAAGAGESQLARAGRAPAARAAASARDAERYRRKGWLARRLQRARRRRHAAAGARCAAAPRRPARLGARQRAALRAPRRTPAGSRSASCAPPAGSRPPACGGCSTAAPSLASDPAARRRGRRRRPPAGPPGAAAGCSPRRRRGAGRPPARLRHALGHPGPAATSSGARCTASCCETQPRRRGAPARRDRQRQDRGLPAGRRRRRWRPGRSVLAAGARDRADRPDGGARQAALPGERVAVLHSGLSAGERLLAYARRRARRGAHRASARARRCSRRSSTSA